MTRVGPAAILAMLASCYAAYPPKGAPCDDDSGCPLGQGCMQGTCGGPLDVDAAIAMDGQPIRVDAGPDNDVDDDGVLNPEDNCPTIPNVGQGNEDTDDFGDACDPCPIEDNDAPADPDGDGVADGCDPNPTVGGDQILLFEGFHDGVPATWEVKGSATKMGDDVRLVATGGSGNHAYLVPPVTAPARGTVTTSAILLATTGNNDSDFGPAMPYDPATDDGIHCELYSPLALETANRIVSLWDSIANAEPGARPYAWVTNTRYRMTFRRTGNTYSCSAAAGTASPTTATGTTSSAPVTKKIALRQFAGTAQISYLLVVKSP